MLFGHLSLIQFLLYLPQLTLRGVHQRSSIGLLSLFEHYGSCEVGSYLKMPEFPIWLVYAESHFSVLFSEQLALVDKTTWEDKFDVHYYDQLAQMPNPYILTIGEEEEKKGEEKGGWERKRRVQLCVLTAACFFFLRRPCRQCATAVGQGPGFPGGALHQNKVRNWSWERWWENTGGGRPMNGACCFHV